MKKKIWIIVIAAVLAVVVGGVAICFLLTHSWVDGLLVHNGAQALDLSGKENLQVEELQKLKALKYLNLEGTGITVSQYEALRQLLPECEISWLVPFQGQYLSPDTRELTLSALSLEDVEVLDYLPQLTRVDATACRDYEALRLLQSRHPACQVSYQVLLGGQSLPHSSQAVSVSCETVAEVAAALENLPQLTKLHVTGCRDAAGLKALADRYPQLDFTYDVYFGDWRCPSDSPSITFDAAELAQLDGLLPCFEQVTHVNLTGPAAAQEAQAMADKYPQIQFHYSFELLGVTVHTDDTLLDLSGIAMDNTQALEAALPYFHKLTQVEMLNCGIANEEMAALNRRHDDILFVWSVRIANRSFRTDIKYFYPTGWGFYVTDDNLVNLKYCTELEALDLGHFHLSDCSFVEYMPKLKYLVLAIGTIQDIRPVGTLKELRFLELFMSEVTDYWPLLNCTSLETLNLSYSGHGDITPLLQMPWLDHLWLCNHGTTDAEKAQLAMHLPNTIMVFNSSSSTDKGWRNSPNYYAMRDVLGASYMTV